DALVIRTFALPIRVNQFVSLSISIESLLHSNSVLINFFSPLIIHPLSLGHFIFSHLVLSALQSPSNIGDSQLDLPQSDSLGNLH
ncbi:hypothetical protein PMAYCL1PPCAC_11313, partial [Pristionchus mayeri]